MVKYAFAAALAVLAGPAAANWLAPNGAQVFQLKDGQIEVVGSVGAGAQDYWCGAGDFAIGGLGTKNTQRVYMWSEVGPSTVIKGRHAIRFGLQEPPSGAAPQSYSLSMHRIGDNMSASQARNYCSFPLVPDF